LFQVSVGDITTIRPNVGFAAPVSSVVDITKNGLVQVSDITSMRSFVGVGQLRLITIPAAGSADEGEGSSGGSGLLAAPGVETPKGNVGSDRPLEIKARWTDESFDVPLPVSMVTEVANARRNPVVEVGVAPESSGTTDPGLLSLDAYFEELSRKKVVR
jgi:hypothetical protein